MPSFNSVFSCSTPTSPLATTAAEPSIGYSQNGVFHSLGSEASTYLRELADTLDGIQKSVDAKGASPLMQKNGQQLFQAQRTNLGRTMTSVTESTNSTSTGAEQVSQQQSYSWKQKKRNNGLNEGEKYERFELKNEEKTTVMVRNIPNVLKQNELLQAIDERGFKGTYNFLYLPIDFASHANCGYAFVNFFTEQAMVAFSKAFSNLRLHPKSQKVLL